MAFIARAVPQRRFGAAARTAAAMAAGLILSLGTMAARALSDPRRPHLWIGVAMSAIGVLICWWLARAWHGQRLAVE